MQKYKENIGLRKTTPTYPGTQLPIWWLHCTGKKMAAAEFVKPFLFVFILTNKLEFWLWSYFFYKTMIKEHSKLLITICIVNLEDRRQKYKPVTKKIDFSNQTSFSFHKRLKKIKSRYCHVNLFILQHSFHT